MELVFYTNPMSRGRIVRWMLEEIGQPYRTEIMEYGPAMKGPVPGDQPDGQGPGDPAWRDRGHRGGGHHRLSGRCVSRRPGWRRRPATGCAAPITAGCSSPPGRLRPPPPTRLWASSCRRREAHRRLWRLCGGDGRDGRRRLPLPYLTGELFTAADIYFGSQIGFGLRFGWIDKRPAFKALLGAAERPPGFAAAPRRSTTSCCQSRAKPDGSVQPGTLRHRPGAGFCPGARGTRRRGQTLALDVVRVSADRRAGHERDVATLRHFRAARGGGVSGASAARPAFAGMHQAAPGGARTRVLCKFSAPSMRRNWLPA